MKPFHALYKFLALPMYLSIDEGGGGGNGGAGSGAGAVGSGAGAGNGEGGGAGAGGNGAGTAPLPFNAREHLADDGSFKPDWHKAAGVSENLAKKFTRPEALARSYEQLESKIAAKGIIPPGPNATQQERDAFYQALGRPAKPEEYGFAKPDKIGERTVPDALWDKGRVSAWEKRLFEAGLSKEQAQKVVNGAIEESLQGGEMIAQAQQQAVKQAKEALSKEWGSDYDKHLGAAMRAAEQFGFPKDHPAGNDPEFLKLMAKVGAQIAERPGVNQHQQAGSDRVTPAEARVRANTLTKQIAERSKADRQWANSAEAQQMKAEKTRMFQIAHPEDR